MNLSVLWLMIRVLFFLALLAGGAWLGEQITDDPGFMIMSFAGYRVEMAGWIALVLLLISWLLVYLLYGLFSNWRLDQRLLRWRAGRKRQNAERQLEAGLSRLARGDFKAAHSQFKKAASHTSLPAISYLLAAFAAQASGKPTECDQWLQKAEKQPGIDPVLSGLLQALVQLQRGHYERALASLNRLSGQEANPFRQDLLRKIYLQLGDWQQLGEVIATIKKRPGKVSEAVIKAEIQQVSHHMASLKAEALQSYWKQLDTQIKQDAEVMLTAARTFVTLGRQEWAEQLLANHMAPAFHPSLVLAYGELSADPHQQLAVAERWLRDRPNHAELLVTLGRLSLKAALWGKAEDYLETAIALNDHPIAHAELARYCARHGRTADSISHYEKSMAAGYHLPAADIPKKDP